MRQENLLVHQKQDCERKPFPSRNKTNKNSIRFAFKCAQLVPFSPKITSPQNGRTTRH